MVVRSRETARGVFETQRSTVSCVYVAPGPVDGVDPDVHQAFGLHAALEHARAERERKRRAEMLPDGPEQLRLARVRKEALRVQAEAAEAAALEAEEAERREVAVLDDQIREGEQRIAARRAALDARAVVSEDDRRDYTQWEKAQRLHLQDLFFWRDEWHAHARFTRGTADRARADLVAAERDDQVAGRLDGLSPEVVAAMPRELLEAPAPPAPGSVFEPPAWVYSLARAEELRLAPRSARRNRPYIVDGQRVVDPERPSPPVVEAPPDDRDTPLVRSSAHHAQRFGVLSYAVPTLWAQSYEVSSIYRPRRSKRGRR